MFLLHVKWKIFNKIMSSAKCKITVCKEKNNKQINKNKKQEKNKKQPQQQKKKDLFIDKSVALALKKYLNDNAIFNKYDAIDQSPWKKSYAKFCLDSYIPLQGRAKVERSRE